METIESGLLVLLSLLGMRGTSENPFAKCPSWREAEKGALAWLSSKTPSVSATLFAAIRAAGKQASRLVARLRPDASQRLANTHWPAVGGLTRIGSSSPANLGCFAG